MPRYSQHCPTCGWQDDIFVAVGVHPPCPQCGAATERFWSGQPTSIAQDSWEGGKTFENLGPDPVTLHSRSELKRVLKERGLQEFVRHVPVPGSDKSPHTTSWDVPCEATLRNARELVSRVTTIASPAPEAEPGDISATDVQHVLSRYGVH